MHIVSLALGGCIRSEPVPYGLTEDTGGHIRYILGEMQALAKRPDVTCAEIITRLFADRALGAIYASPEERLGPKLIITRIDSGNRNYLAKEALFADRGPFAQALIANLKARDKLPDLIHAHFADAAAIAAVIEDELGIPFIYTPHSLGRDKLATLAAGASAELAARIAEEDQAIERARMVVGSSRDECERQIAAYPSARVDRIQQIVPGVYCPPATDAQRQAARDLIAPFLRSPDKPMIFAVARPVRKKNTAGLIDAFATTPGLSDAANLVVLAGRRCSLDDGESEQVEVMRELVGAIDRHDLYGRVAYPKTHDHAIVAALYSLAAESGGLFANPALVEPYGLTIVEAAAYGLPVVATQVGGPYDIVSELGHGLLIDPTDNAALGEAMMRLLSDRELWHRCAGNGRERAKSHSWDRYAGELAAIAHRVTRPALPAEAVSCPIRHLLVSDIDNTLTGCRRSAARFAHFLRRRPEYGFAVATGRSIVEAQRLMREWDLPEPRAWITSVGTEIYLPQAGHLAIESEFATSIQKQWQPDAVVAALSTVDGLSQQAPYEQRRFKRSYFMDSPEVAGEVRAILTRAGIAARVVASHQRLLDVLPVNAGKGAAMRYLARRLDVDMEQVFAAGDSGNDSDMLIACLNPILVGNYAEEVAHLRQRPGIYVSRRHNAGGTLEGLIMQTRRRRASARLPLKKASA